MKQISVYYKDDAVLMQDIERVRQLWEQCGHNVGVCKIFATHTDALLLQHVSGILDEQLPDMLYYGCTCNGIIDAGEYVQQELMLRFTFYEDSTSRVEIMQFDNFETDSLTVAARVVSYCRDNPWIGSLELIASTLLHTNLSEFCRALEVLDESLPIFGGVACCHDIAKIESLSLSKGYAPCSHTLLAIAKGGPNLHVSTARVYGWTPMGREFIVTKCRDGILYELDHEPAFNIYRKYLDIEPDENLFVNVIEFPLYLKRRGQTIMLCSFDVNDDSSLNIKADIPEGTGIRLSYGDPVHLLSEAYDAARSIAPFTPQYIDLFSCSARRAVWGDDMVSKESRHFNTIATTTGFFGHGEIIRTGRTLLNYNELMVIAAFREGPAGEPIDPDKLQHFIDRRNYNLRLSHFISVASQELEDSVKQLRHMAITDGMTQLCNRKETQHRIEEAVNSCANGSHAKSFSLIMMDIDNFKSINDVYGHQAGDEVILKLSSIIREAAKEYDGSSSGRWGGEEFMLLLPDASFETSWKIAEKLRTEFSQAVFAEGRRHTVSLGITEYKKGDTGTSVCQRVDKALYISKEAGKNRVCRL